LMASERPKKLNKLEREQYGVMLEEQAYPFEEKAVEIHSLNAQRAASGVYDPWVRSSFDALRELLPVRYGKTERADGASASAEAQALNQRGIAQRQGGAFTEARTAYEQAIALDANYRSAILNLGILQDLYLGDAPAAQAQYQHYLDLTPQGDATVSKWLAEIKNRKEKP
jgi:tetratricopeptide (TPR) repeat protein